MDCQYKEGNVLNIYSGWCAITEAIWRKCMQRNRLRSTLKRNVAKNMLGTTIIVEHDSEFSRQTMYV